MKFLSRFFSQGWWIIALLAVFTAGAIVKDVLIPIFEGHYIQIVGDGKHVNSYGFTLSPCLIPRNQIVSSGNSKNGLIDLLHPGTLSARHVRRLNKAMRDSGGFIGSANRVIGVVIKGHARAYPIAMLNWHEVVNDQIGSTPIAVTYDGFCDSAMVFDRRIAAHTQRFGYSGLVYNSNLLLYDQQPQASEESLWSQLQHRAIAGPAAAKRQSLTVIACQVVTWGYWRNEHPKTRMIAGERSLYPAYRKSPYSSYFFQQSNFHYPVSPLWNHPDFPAKTRLIVVRLKHHWHPFFFPDLFRQADPTGLTVKVIAGQKLIFQCRQLPGSSTVALLAPEDAPEDAPDAYCLLFAWYAQHPREFIAYR